MKDYQRNNTLYSRLLAAAGDDKLPVLDNKTFESMNAEYGKEEMRKNVGHLFLFMKGTWQYSDNGIDWVPAVEEFKEVA